MEFAEEAQITLHGEELMTPEQVRRLVQKRVGAKFSLRQVARLGDRKILQPVLYKQRRLYRRGQVEDVISSGVIAPAKNDPNTARLKRRELRLREGRPAEKN